MSLAKIIAIIRVESSPVEQRGRILHFIESSAQFMVESEMDLGLKCKASVKIFQGRGVKEGE